MNLTQLKQLKEIPATRIDNSFLSDIEKENMLISQAKEENYNLQSKQETATTIEYTFINPSKETEVRMYIKDTSKVSEYLSNLNREVISYKVISDMLIATVKGDMLYYTLTKNKLAKEVKGKLVFRSKDYYFEFNNNERIYGEPIKSSMLSNNTIKVNDNVTYILEV